MELIGYILLGGALQFGALVAFWFVMNGLGDFLDRRNK